MSKGNTTAIPYAGPPALVIFDESESDPNGTRGWIVGLEKGIDHEGVEQWFPIVAFDWGREGHVATVRHEYRLSFSQQVYNANWDTRE